MLIVDHFCLRSISAQSNFAVGAVVNATFGSITELTFYITALLRGHQAANPCLQEIVKAALTGTLLGCILFIPVSQTAYFTAHFTFLKFLNYVEKKSKFSIHLLVSPQCEWNFFNLHVSPLPYKCHLNCSVNATKIIFGHITLIQHV